MSIIQKFITTVFSKRVADQIKAESQSWIMRCNNCGLERSIWEIGGVRYGAAGNPSRKYPCPTCGRWTWHSVERKQNAN